MLKMDQDECNFSKKSQTCPSSEYVIRAVSKYIFRLKWNTEIENETGNK